MQTVIIIGAPRSGTNILRDILTRIPGIGTWPCDEINYIWRHGNLTYPSDEFTDSMARPEVCDYIQKSFRRIARSTGCQILIEKTCANSLRIGFVDRVFPEAQYIFIRRNGYDVVGSALKRWTAGIEPSYILQKARFVPIGDLPYYANRFIWNRLFRLFSDEKRVAYWGPQIRCMQEWQENCKLEELCAHQWVQCIDAASDALKRIPNERVCRIRYEEFVRSPAGVLAAILNFIGVSTDSISFESVTEDVNERSVGRGQSELGDEVMEKLLPIMGETLKRHGYL